MRLFKQDLKIGTNTLRNILDGTFFYKGLIRKNLAYIIFCTLLLVFYIGNRYKCEGQLTQIGQLEKEINDLHYESITTSAELMSVSRQSEVARLIKDRGLDLEESTTAPQHIYLED